MYSFEPSEEQKMLVDAIQRFSANDLRPQAHDADEENQLPPALIEKGWELGYLQASIPEEYGGFGERSAVCGVLAAEELAWGDLAGGMAVMLPGLFTVPILLAGSQTQKETYLEKVIEAEKLSVSKEDVDAHFEEIGKAREVTGDVMRKLMEAYNPGSIGQIENQLLDKKVFDFLAGQLNVVEKPFEEVYGDENEEEEKEES